MTVAVDLLDTAIEALDTKTSDEGVVCLSLAATMKLYGLGRLSCRAVPESAGNGRVEFLDRLTKYGGNSFAHRSGARTRALAILRN